MPNELNDDKIKTKTGQMKDTNCGCELIGGLVSLFILISVFGSILLSPLMVVKITHVNYYHWLFIASVPLSILFAIKFVEAIESQN